MADEISGKDGTITIDANEETPISNWSINTTSANDPFHTNASAGWMERRGGTKDSTGTFQMKGTPSVVEGQRVDFVGYTGADIYTQSIIIDSIGVTTDITGGTVVTYEVAFSGDGALTKSTGSFAG